MLSPSDLHYVVRYCSGLLVGLYAVVVRLALGGQILFRFSRMSLCTRRQICIMWPDTVQVYS